MRYYSIIYFFIIGFSVSYSQDKQLIKIEHLEIPKLKLNEQIVKHVAYTLSYNEKHEQANWVAYELTNHETNSIVKRGNKFIVDPLVLTLSANTDDYSKSGFDRGHLAPAADMGWSIISMEESFYYSNMSPQLPAFNRGIWKRTEELVRKWAKIYSSVYVVTGPVLMDSLPSIGLNKVSIPKYYYKVVLDYNHSHAKAIGFLMPNEGAEKELEYFAISIDSVEKVTGIDFFPLLPDEQETLIESKVNFNDWSWTRLKQYDTKNDIQHTVETDTSKKHHLNLTPKHKEDHKVDDKNANMTSVQCTGKTKKGARCKISTKNISGRCYLHD